MKRVTLLLLLLSISSFASEPIQVLKTKAVQYPHHYIGIKYQNIGDKEVKATKFSVTFVNAVGDRQADYTEYSIEQAVKPGKSRYFTIDCYVPTRRAEARVEKVLYADGSTWERQH
jgi:hypothetical protein